MKLSSILEARYAFTSYVDEIEQIIQADRDAAIPFAIDHFEQVVADIEKRFGENLQLVNDETEPEGFRKKSYHYYDDDDQTRWSISVGRYLPSGRAYIRVNNYYRNLNEAQYASDGMPRDLIGQILHTNDKTLVRGIQHPTMTGTISYKDWLADNEEHIEDLYQEIKTKLEAVAAYRNYASIQDWLDRNYSITWSAMHKFVPSLREYRNEAASTQMYIRYFWQIKKIAEIITAHLKEKYQ